MNYELFLTALGVVVTILVPMGAGFSWLYRQIREVRDELKTDIKEVRDELKADIKRVEDKLDHKEASLRKEICANKDVATAADVEQKLQLQRVAIQSEERAKETRTLQERFEKLITALKRELPQLEI